MRPQHIILNNIFSKLHIVSRSVDSNDTLYGSDPKYLSEVAKLSQTLADQVLTHIKALDTPEVGDITDMLLLAQCSCI